MEVIPAAPHRIFDVREASHTGEVRRAAVQLARDLGFDEAAAGRVALGATELASNLAKHAQEGRMLVAPVRAEDGTWMVELISLDKGPGIADPRACLADGFSTAGTAGTGMGAVRRLSVLFDVFSQAPGGTIVLSRIAGPAPGFVPAAPAGAAAGLPACMVGAVALCAPGEVACGDAWRAYCDATHACVMVADGLGHGPQAAEASEAATAIFGADSLALPSQVLGRVHLGLKATRGAAVALARIDLAAEAVVFAGVGNVTARLITGVEDRSLVSQNGTAGLQIRTVQDVRHPWTAHSLLVMHSDGIASRWSLAEAPELLQHHPTVIAAWLMRNHLRHRDDATAVVIRRRHL
jgi:anti-sigma regulatory factor (Ser/Thr protein kinase)